MVTDLRPQSLQLRIYPGPDGLLRLTGELDMASRPELCSALQRQLDAGQQRCVLDLTELSFCDSAGLSALVWADHAFPRGVLLHGPGRQLRKILRATNLEQFLTIE